MSSISRLAAKPTGGVSSSYLTDFLAIRGIGGHPQARATLGKPGYMHHCRHNQLKSDGGLKKFKRRTMLAIS
ncbi:protein of unknown function [Aminobacter niigataensis]|nr:protein of unknown function [Aminobacter niigataensis]